MTNESGPGMRREKGLILGTVIYFIGTVSSSLLQFLFVPVITQLLSAEDYAYFDLAYNMLLMLIPVLTLQAMEALFRMLIDAREEDRAAYVSTVAAICLTAFVVFGLLLFAATQLFDFVRYPALLYTYFAGLMVYQFYQKVARSMAENKLYVGISVFQTALVLGLQLLLLLKFELKAEAMFISGAISLLAASLVYEVKLKLRRHFSLRAITARIRSEILRFSVPLIPDYVSWWSVSQVSRYILVASIGLGQVGIYNMAFKFSFIVTMVTHVFQLAWQENAIRESGAEDTHLYYNRTFASYMRLVMSMLLVLIPVTPFILPIMLRNEYYAAADYVPWIYLISVFEAFMLFMSTGYIVSKKTIGASVTIIAGSIFSILFTLCFVRALGVYAVIFGSILSYALVWLLRTYHLRHTMGVRIPWMTFLWLLLLVGLFIAAYRLLPPWVMAVLLPAGAILFLFINRELLRMLLGSLFSKRQK